MSVTRRDNSATLGDASREPLVSVVIPVYNGAASLDTAVSSVLRQSLTDLEILIVDDGSTDQTGTVAHGLAARDPRIRVIRLPCNRGQAAARNVAVERARGRWIAPLDADDEIAASRLRTLVDAGEDAAADLIADGVEFAGLRQPGTPNHLRAGDGVNGELQTLSLEALIRSDIPLNGLCSFGYLKPLMRRDFLARWQLRYDEDLRFSEDLNLYVRALLCGGRFVLHPRVLYIYNQTPVSASRDIQVLPRVADHALVNNRRLRELARQSPVAGLDALLEEHGERWSTVLWFNRLKLALRTCRISDVVQLTLDCPSRPRDVFRFARDRARVKARAGARVKARAAR